MVAGTDAQDKLGEFKKRNSYTPEDVTKFGSIGQRYWFRFMKRNKDQIVRRRRQKYELDRPS